jgi:hypothetical protein
VLHPNNQEGNLPGFYWYLALAAVGLGVAAYTLCKSNEKAKLICFYLFASLAADAGEILVMMVFRSYSYKLGIPGDYVLNNIVGHVIPNSTLWPATAILTAAFSLRFRWILLISVVYMMLDVLFIRLGLYEHNWWKTYMTGIAILVYCLGLKKWFYKMEDTRFRFLRYLTFSSILSVIILLPSITLLVTGRIQSNSGLYQNQYRDGVVFLFLLNTSLSFISTYFICVLQGWYWKAVPFVIYGASNAILYTKGVIHVSGGWSVYCTILVNAICILAFIALERKCSFKPSGNAGSRSETSLH